MKNWIIITALLTVHVANSLAQVEFSKGYFITDANQKVECLIKNKDWDDNPESFKYKNVGEELIHVAEIKIIKEFGIDSLAKYIRATVKIDETSDRVGNLKSEKEPVFQVKQLFLKVLLEGDASLYVYEKNKLERFFYNVDTMETSQLVYKRYLINGEIAENNLFRQQLYLDMNCQCITMDEFNTINYSKRDLKRIFVKYNNCKNSAYIDYTLKKSNAFFNFSLKLGLNNTDLKINNIKIPHREIKFDNNYNAKIGFEAELILPFNKNKWSVILEPTYCNYKSEKSMLVSNVSGGSINALVSYQSIEFPLMLRHYFYLNKNSKLFVNGSVMLNYAGNSNISLTRNDNTELNYLNLKSGVYGAIGMGFKYNDKYSLEMRYYTNRNILYLYNYWESDFNEFSVVFGYSLF